MKNQFIFLFYFIFSGTADAAIPLKVLNIFPEYTCHQLPPLKLEILPGGNGRAAV